MGTARLVRSCVSNATLITGTGHEFDRDARLLGLVDAEAGDAFVLYPGRDAIDIGAGPSQALEAKSRAGKPLVVLVIDGTWSHAKKMIRESKLLSSLPQIAFTPARPSSYRIREQPGEICMSTIEAVHATLELLSRSDRWPLPRERAHEQLLEVFDRMVERQIELERERQPAQ